MKPVTQSTLLLEKSPQHILTHLNEIIALADSETSSLGFLSKQALRDGIERGKMLVFLDRSSEKNKLVAYLLYSGVFPHAKIQQIATIKSYRQRGVASALIRALVAELERINFMTVQANIAADRAAALAFYKKNGFERVRTQKGGKARNRPIIVHVRELDTPTLFAKADKHEIDLGIRERSAREAPFFALDLNVYFDLVKNRSQSNNARRLFGAALDHKIRLTVADELVKELRQTSDRKKRRPDLATCSTSTADARG